MINIKRIIRRKGMVGILKSLQYHLLCWDDIFWTKFIFKHLPIKDKWIFFQSEGDFSDNAKALYDYMRENLDDEFKFIWLVKNPKNYPRLKNTIFISSKPCILIGQKIKWYYAYRAKYLFFTHHAWYKNRRHEQVRINLWHGVAIKGKKGGFSHKNTFEFTLVTSDFFQVSQSAFLGCDPQKVISLGYPRNDLLQKKFDKKRLFKLLDCDSKDKIIVWMPTFRNSINKEISEDYYYSNTGLPLLKDEEDLYELDRFMDNTNLRIVIKIHHLQASNRVFNKQYRNINILNDNLLEKYRIQLYELLAHSDALITDYSSVYIDYLLKNNPIGFILDDYINYKRSRGFMFENPIELMPGHHILKKEDFYNFLDEIKNEIDSFSVERNKILKLTHKYIDANSSQRIIDYFQIK